MVNDLDSHDPLVIMGFTEGIGGEMNMVVVMAALIVYGDITFDQIPSKSKDAVKMRLGVLGYDENGQPLESI